MSIGSDFMDHLQGYVRQLCRAYGLPSDVDALEALAVEASQVVGRALVEEGLPKKDDKAGYAGSSVPCECGKRAEFVTYRRRYIQTLFVCAPAWRGYYYCDGCHSGRVPWDRQQGLSSLHWSPRVKGLMAQLAGRLPYGEATSLLAQLTGVAIEESAAERIVAEVGGRLRAEEAALMDGYDCGEVTPLVPQAPKRLYVGADGTSAHIDHSSHEVKVGVVYEAEPDDEGIDTACRIRYVAAQETAERFGQRLYVMAAQAGVEHADEVVVIGDGAEWIWRLADHHYLHATHIVDYWHACEHIHDLAHSIYGADSAKGKRWAHDHCRWLKERGPGTLLGALKRMKPKSPDQADAVKRETGYFGHNRHRMDYPAYRQRGMMIGSGPVEAGCKSVVGARLKRTGMRWSSPGADCILAIRSALLSGREDRVNAMAKAA